MATAMSGYKPTNRGTVSDTRTDPTGQPQLTTIKVTIVPHTALPWHIPARSVRVALHEILDEHQGVVLAFSQRWHLNGGYV
jgi:hypothetical protein